MSSRILTVLGILIAGLCLIRVLTVAAKADEAVDMGDVEEVYSNSDSTPSDAAQFDSRTTDDDEVRRPEIRLTRPDEAAKRVADNEGYELVPGADKVIGLEQAQAALQVPHKDGRRIASVPTTQPVAEALKTPTNLTHKTSTDTITHSPSADDGLAVTPMEPKPAVAAISQEVSLIVSDYGFFPKRIFATQGVPLKIYMSTPSKATLCFMIDAWGVKKGIIPGKVEEISFTPDQPGNFRFYCPVKSIEGTLSVREAPIPGGGSRNLASEPAQSASAGNKGKWNEPKNAAELRALIED